MRRLLACVLLLAATLSSHAQERFIQKEIVVPAPLAEVWKSWTTKAGIESFMAPEAVIDARAEGAFHIHLDPYAPPGRKGADTMRYMALQPMKMLSFDWNAPPHLAEVRAQRTFVVVRFHPVNAKSTRVSLHHTGWGDGGEWDRAYAYFDTAWGRVLESLKERHETGPVDWTEWKEQLRKRRAAPAN